MNYEVSEKKGDSLVVGLTETEEGRYTITIDGRTVQVDAVRSGPAVYSIIEDGQQFEVLVDEKGAHGFDVMLGGRIFHLEALDERTRLLAGSAQAVASGPQQVEAEMPGKVTAVNVAPGDAVTEGQGLVVIEAMKMENDIVAPVAGVVTEVSVSEGDTVEAGSPLFTVEPPDDA